MYVETMTSEQLLEEFTADVDQLSGRIAHRTRQWIRKAAKAKKFPIKEYEIAENTKRGNKYIVTYKLENKKDVKKVGTGILIHFYGLMNTSNGVAVVDCNSNYIGMQCFSSSGVSPAPVRVYSPHLFDRYTERFGKECKGDIRVQFFMRNDYSSTMSERLEGKHGEEYDVISITNDGILLGTSSDINLFNFRTFLNYDQLTKKQMEHVQSVADFEVEHDDAFNSLVPNEMKTIYAYE